jgi:hypothetical protein
MQVQGRTEDGLVKVMGFGKKGRVTSHEVALRLRSLQDDSWSPSKRPANFSEEPVIPTSVPREPPVSKGRLWRARETRGRRNRSDRVNAVHVPSAA